MARCAAGGGATTAPAPLTAGRAVAAALSSARATAPCSKGSILAATVPYKIPALIPGDQDPNILTGSWIHVVA